MSRLNKVFSKKWEPGDRPLVRGLPDDETIDKIKEIIPQYLNAFQTQTISREMVLEAYRHVIGKGISHLACTLLHNLLEDELQTMPRLKRGRRTSRD